jgi:hypothetical protein
MAKKSTREVTFFLISYAPMYGSICVDKVTAVETPKTYRTSEIEPILGASGFTRGMVVSKSYKFYDDYLIKVVWDEEQAVQEAIAAIDRMRNRALGLADKLSGQREKLEGRDTFPNLKKWW